MTVYRPDLADADGAEVSHWLLEHGIGEVATAPAEDAMAISSTSNTDSEVEAALVGFTPTVPAGEYVHVPPELRPHQEHLRVYLDAERDGTMDAWTQAEWKSRTAHALADAIAYIRKDHQEEGTNVADVHSSGPHEPPAGHTRKEEPLMGDKRTPAEKAAAEADRIAKQGQAEAEERRDAAADQANLPDTTATPDTDVSTEAEALEEGAPSSSGAIDTEPEPAPAADTDATTVESTEGR